MRTLVTYASAKGSTHDIAGTIASHLQAAGITVDLTPVDRVEFSTLPRYSSVIIGSPIHMQHWLRPACSFISHNVGFLKAMSVWAFSTGMPPNEDQRVKEEQMIEKKIRKEIPDLQGHKLFFGRIEQESLGWFMRAIFKCCISEKEIKDGDQIDWEEIGTWARKVGEEIHTSQMMI